MATTDPSPVSYEDLANLEDEFDQVDTEVMRKQYELSAAVYAKRTEAIKKIPNFWALVLEQSPPEVDQYIQPEDSRILAESLLSIEVRRPELDIKGSGNPRSISVKFEFKPNEAFEDTVLEKTFWHRRSRDDWTGLVSEPVKIHWKEGKDLTEGLTDGAVALWEARTKIGDMSAKGLPEYTSLKKKVESWNGMNTSFFTWFGWVSSRRYVSAEESAEANEKHEAIRELRKAAPEGIKNPVSEGFPKGDDELEAEEAELDDEAVEVHEAGEELAIAFAEDLWPNAIKYFTQAQEVEEMSDVDFEDDEDEDSAEEGDNEPIDIRSLVQEGKGRGRESLGNGGPPSKKQKK
jgi:hypothetical protein